MATSPSVTVLLPVKRPDPEFFAEALGSVSAQTFQDFELLIVEAPSDRPVGPLLARAAEPRIRHVQMSADASMVDQLNHGLELARAPLIARFDADDVCEPHRLAAQVDFLARNAEVDVLGSQLLIVTADGTKRGTRRYPLDHDAIVAAMPRYNPLAHPAVMFRREVVRRAGGYRSQRGAAQDYELWSRLARDRRRFGNHPDILLRYRLHPQSVKLQRLRETLRATLEVKQMYWQDRLRGRARLRMLGERLLLWLPPRLVYRLFWSLQRSE